MKETVAHKICGSPWQIRKVRHIIGHLHSKHTDVKWQANAGIINKVILSSEAEYFEIMVFTLPVWFKTL